MIIVIVSTLWVSNLPRLWLSEWRGNDLWESLTWPLVIPCCSLYLGCHTVSCCIMVHLGYRDTMGDAKGRLSPVLMHSGIVQISPILLTAWMEAGLSWETSYSSEARPSSIHHQTPYQSPHPRARHTGKPTGLIAHISSKNIRAGG